MHYSALLRLPGRLLTKATGLQGFHKDVDDCDLTFHIYSDVLAHFRFHDVVRQPHGVLTAQRLPPRREVQLDLKLIFVTRRIFDLFIALVKVESEGDTELVTGTAGGRHPSVLQNAAFADADFRGPQTWEHRTASACGQALG